MPRRDDDSDDRPRKRAEKKKGSPWLWIVLGCGGVAVLGTIQVLLENGR